MTAWQRRLPTSSAGISGPPPPHVLRAYNPHTLFFDFRAHPALSTSDVLRILTDPELAYAEDVLGITFVPKHRLAQVVFRTAAAVAYHRAEAGARDADVPCWDAIHPDRPLRTIWLRGTPIAHPPLLQAWIRDAIEQILPGDNDWTVHDVRLQFYPGTQVLTDAVAVTLVLPAIHPAVAAPRDRELAADALLEATLPRELAIGPVPDVQLTWPGAPPYCPRCHTVGHSSRNCPLSSSSSLSSPSSSNRHRGRPRGRRGGRNRVSISSTTAATAAAAPPPPGLLPSPSELSPPPPAPHQYPASSSVTTTSDGPSLLQLPAAEVPDATTAAHHQYLSSSAVVPPYHHVLPQHRYPNNDIPPPPPPPPQQQQQQPIDPSSIIFRQGLVVDYTAGPAPISERSSSLASVTIPNADPDDSLPNHKTSSSVDDKEQDKTATTTTPASLHTEETTPEQLVNDESAPPERLTTVAAP